jgi:hypothetical protein
METRVAEASAVVAVTMVGAVVRAHLQRAIIAREGVVTVTSVVDTSSVV